MQPAIALLVCLGAADGSQSSGREEIPFVAECILAHAGPAELDGRLVLADGGAAEDLLREHAREHGWSWLFREPDRIEPQHGAACPAQVLDYLELAGADKDPGDCFTQVLLAEALARNGRVEQSLELIERSALAPPDESRRGYTGSHCSSLRAECAARIALRAGQWERALELSEDWVPIGNCSFGLDIKRRQIMRLRARCWVELGRCDLVREEALKSFDRGGNPELIELWIEGQIRQGLTRDASQALEAILSEAPPASWPNCREGLRRWVARAPASELGQH